MGCSTVKKIIKDAIFVGFILITGLVALIKWGVLKKQANKKDPGTNP